MNPLVTRHSSLVTACAAALAALAAPALDFSQVAAVTIPEGAVESISTLDGEVLWQRTPTARDYVQDGLIAMWDGIENAGWGVHDPNATVWKDLIGGREFNLLNSLYVIGENQISLQRLPGSANLSCDIGEPHLGEFTLEAWGDDGVSNGYLPNISYGGFGVTYDYPTWTYVLTANDGNYRTDFSIKSGALSVMSPSKHLYYNGEFRSVSKFWNGTRPSSNNISLGLSKTKYLAFRFVRLYSRALSAEEIQHNYAIDKERFGLP